MIQYGFPFLAAEISTWLDHPRPAADTTQLEELPGTWPAGPMVRITKTLYISNIFSEKIIRMVFSPINHFYYVIISFITIPITSLKQKLFLLWSNRRHTNPQHTKPDKLEDKINDK